MDTLKTRKPKCINDNITSAHKRHQYPEYLELVYFLDKLPLRGKKINHSQESYQIQTKVKLKNSTAQLTQMFNNKNGNTHIKSYVIKGKYDRRCY